MPLNWENLEHGPSEAAHSVLLLPGGSCAARSYELVMVEPALQGVRLVATTLPGNAGAPLGPANHTVEAQAREAAEFARTHGCDVLVGFSCGATVALEMLLSGQFTGPTVLLGISLTTPDEAGFFVKLVRLSQRLGPWPMALLIKVTSLMIRQSKLPRDHAVRMREDAARNIPTDLTRMCGAYLDYIAGDGFAERLVASGVRTWVVHAEKGDGGLTAAERATLEAGSNVTVVTIPGSVFFLPNEVPRRIAEVIAEAVAAAG